MVNHFRMQNRLSEIGIIPVIKLEDTKDAEPLAQALYDGGLPAAEVTFRVAGAEMVIEAMSKAFPDMIVGAGTVLTLEQVQSAVDAGAKFIVSPGFDETIVSHCVNSNIPVFPGCITPTEIQMALKHGLKVVKFFPAAQYGGLETIKALAAPFSGIRFMPTGGISLKNLKEYVENKHVAACGGSFMVTEALISGKHWSEITRISSEAREIIDIARM